MANPDYKKIIQALNYLATKEGGSIDYLKAIKLLYLADRLHLRKYGRLITDDHLVAMWNGTLGSMTKDIANHSQQFLPYEVYKYSEDKLARDKAAYTITAKSEDKDRLSDTDMECMNEVFKTLGSLDGFKLGDLTHNLPEWKRHEYVITKKEKLKMDLEPSDLFEVSDGKENLGEIYMQSPNDLELSKELFFDSKEQESLIEFAQ